MRALFLSLFSILFIANCQAQIYTNLSVVSSLNMNIIYRGLPNPIAIAVSGYQVKDIIVSASEGTLTKSDELSTYYLEVPNENKSRELTINVFVKISKSKTKLVGLHKYRLKNFPEPTIMLGAIEQSGFYNTAQIRSALFVYTALKNFAFEGIKYTPVKYTIVYKPTVGEEKIMYGNGPIITQEIQQLFNNVKLGDKIILQDVTASGPNGIISLKQQLFLEVKD